MVQTDKKQHPADPQGTGMKRSRYEWLKDVGIADLLSGDMKLVFECCGIDTLITLYEHFASMEIYVSGKPLDRIKRRYIETFFTGNNVKELCVILGASQRFIYDVLEEQNAKVNKKRNSATPAS
jgi:hypothetical protein